MRYTIVYMIVIILIFAATILYTMFDLFVAKAGGKLNDNLAAIIFNGIGAIVPLFIYMLYRSKSNAETSTSGIVYSVLAGISIAAFSVILVNLFARAENVSFILPAIYGGTVILGSLAGIYVFKETLNPFGLAGVALTALGISLLVYSRLHTT